MKGTEPTFSIDLGFPIKTYGTALSIFKFSQGQKRSSWGMFSSAFLK